MSLWKSSKTKFDSGSVEQHVIRLDVDVYRENDRLVIYAPVVGADISDIDISIEGDSNVVVISGRAYRPPLPPRKGKRSGDYVTLECVWGEFYRRIILPASVDMEGAEAKLQKGVLILSLPLL